VNQRRLLGLLVAAVLAACSSPASSPSADVPSAPSSEPPASSSAEPGSASGVSAADLTIFGAASLKGALEQAKVAYESANPGTTLTISTDSSAALETQIEQGAPADVFLSADTSHPKKLVDGGFASGEAVPFAANKLTIIVPTDNPGGVTSPMDLATSGLKVIAAGDGVPITKYAKQLVTNLAGLSGYPANFDDAYAANVVSKEDNVKAVVAKIELGEGDAGIVYVTDAAASDKVKAVDVPDEANVPANYEGVVVKASPDQAAATAFLDWLAGAEGREVLQQFGFMLPAS
jgi:molybdate transport system substrate-binding protein